MIFKIFLENIFLNSEEEIKKTKPAPNKPSQAERVPDKPKNKTKTSEIKPLIKFSFFHFALKNKIKE